MCCFISDHILSSWDANILTQFLTVLSSKGYFWPKTTTQIACSAVIPFSHHSLTNSSHCFFSRSIWYSVASRRREKQLRFVIERSLSGYIQFRSCSISIFFFPGSGISRADFSLKLEENIVSNTGEATLNRDRWTCNFLSSTSRTRSLDFQGRENGLWSLGESKLDLEKTVEAINILLRATTSNCFESEGAVQSRKCAACWEGFSFLDLHNRRQPLTKNGKNSGLEIATCRERRLDNWTVFYFWAHFGRFL